MERKTGFEPATLALARRCSTTEPLPHKYKIKHLLSFNGADGGTRTPMPKAPDPKSGASANFATSATWDLQHND